MAGHLAVADLATKTACFSLTTVAFFFIAMLALPDLYS
jgi:hypothetical protein